MPVFFFQFRDGDGVIADPEGMNLPDLRAARREACAAAREIVAHRIKAGAVGVRDEERFEIADEGGRVLATVSFSDAIRPLVANVRQGP